MTTTIVTAFLYSEDHYQNLEFYIENGKKLLNFEMNKIIFIDERVHDKFSDFFTENHIFIPITKETLYLHTYLPKLTNKVHGNPEKDTNMFFSIMCNKTEWMREAIHRNPFCTDYFVWVDFGISKILNNTLNIECLSKPYENIRIGSIWNPTFINSADPYTEICWYFAGGVFGGHKDYLLLFADIMKKEVLEFIKKNNYLVWEVNFWYLIYKKHKNLFTLYFCNHDTSIINNY